MPETPTIAPPEPSVPARPAAAPVPRWAIHRRLYDAVLAWSHSRHATAVLFLLAVAESSLFPVPPDVLQIALTLERRSRAFYYAAVSTVGSVVGGILGYAIGWGFWKALEGFFFRHIFSQDVFHRVEVIYQRYDFWAIFIAAFTPIPYKVFTIAAGVFSISLPMFIIASAVGRGGRFFLVAALLWKFGAPVRSFIERYFNLLTIVFVILLAGAVAVLELL